VLRFLYPLRVGVIVPITNKYSMYATQRAGLALDKMVFAKTAFERQQAHRWVLAWTSLASRIHHP
jgi:hypothetical protein